MALTLTSYHSQTYPTADSCRATRTRPLPRSDPHVARVGVVALISRPFATCRPPWRSPAAPLGFVFALRLTRYAFLFADGRASIFPISRLPTMTRRPPRSMAQHNSRHRSAAVVSVTHINTTSSLGGRHFAPADRSSGAEGIEDYPFAEQPWTL